MRTRGLMRRPPAIPCIFGYVGQKRGLIGCYPPPSRSLIIEPFAGSAGYARRWGAGRDVVLVEKAKWLADMWKWLIQATRDEIMSLPLLEQIPREGLSAIPGLRAEARSLLGLKINLTNHPANTPTKLALQHQHDNQIAWWNPAGRKAVADALRWIRHWSIVQGEYHEAPSVDATWFIDPPYQRLPTMYSEKVDSYDELAAWCCSRRGQVIVCDDVRAMWLPFKPVNSALRKAGAHANTGQKQTGMEGVWIRG